MTGDVGEKLNFPLVAFDGVVALVGAVVLVVVKVVEVVEVVADWVVDSAVVEPDVVQVVAVVAVETVERDGGDWIIAGT